MILKTGIISMLFSYYSNMKRLYSDVSLFPFQSSFAFRISNLLISSALSTNFSEVFNGLCCLLLAPAIATCFSGRWRRQVVLLRKTRPTCILSTDTKFYFRYSDDICDGFEVLFWKWASEMLHAHPFQTHS